MSVRADPKGIPAQKRARRSSRMALLASIVSEIEADAVLDAQAEGIELAKSAVLKMQDGRSDAEKSLIIEIYQNLEALRRDQATKIRDRLAATKCEGGSD